MSNTKQRQCPTCMRNMDGPHCPHCEPARWYDDLADWHEQQARWARGAADEVRGRGKR